MNNPKITSRRMLRPSLAGKVGVVSLGVFVGGALFAGPPPLPPNYPKAQYDEAKIPPYTCITKTSK